MSSAQYKVLGLTSRSNPTEREVTLAYRKLSLQYHPDKAPDDPDAARKFCALNDAYEAVKESVKIGSSFAPRPNVQHSRQTRPPSYSQAGPNVQHSRQTHPPPYFQAGPTPFTAANFERYNAQLKREEEARRAQKARDDEAKAWQHERTKRQAARQAEQAATRQAEERARDDADWAAYKAKRERDSQTPYAHGNFQWHQADTEKSSEATPRAAQRAEEAEARKAAHEVKQEEAVRRRRLSRIAREQAERNAFLDENGLEEMTRQAAKRAEEQEAACLERMKRLKRRTEKARKIAEQAELDAMQNGDMERERDRRAAIKVKQDANRAAQLAKQRAQMEEQRENERLQREDALRLERQIREGRKREQEARDREIKEQRERQQRYEPLRELRSDQFTFAGSRNGNFSAGNKAANVPKNEEPFNFVNIHSYDGTSSSMGTRHYQADFEATVRSEGFGNLFETGETSSASRPPKIFAAGSGKVDWEADLPMRSNTRPYGANKEYPHHQPGDSTSRDTGTVFDWNNAQYQPHPQARSAHPSVSARNRFAKNPGSKSQSRPFVFNFEQDTNTRPSTSSTDSTNDQQYGFQSDPSDFGFEAAPARDFNPRPASESNNNPQWDSQANPSSYHAAASSSSRQPTPARSAFPNRTRNFDVPSRGPIEYVGPTPIIKDPHYSYQQKFNFQPASVKQEYPESDRRPKHDWHKTVLNDQESEDDRDRTVLNSPSRFVQEPEDMNFTPSAGNFRRTDTKFFTDAENSQRENNIDTPNCTYRRASDFKELQSRNHDQLPGISSFGVSPSKNRDSPMSRFDFGGSGSSNRGFDFKGSKSSINPFEFRGSNMSAKKSDMRQPTTRYVRKNGILVPYDSKTDGFQSPGGEDMDGVEYEG